MKKINLLCSLFCVLFLSIASVDVRGITITDEEVEVVDGVITKYSPTDAATTEITIPEVLDGQIIKGIGERAFYNLQLTAVSLPETLKEIGYRAFFYNDIKTLNIPASVTLIDRSAFTMCKIESLTFGENSKLKEIGESAFSSHLLDNIELPDSVTYIGSYAFSSSRSSFYLVFSSAFSSWRASNGELFSSEDKITDMSSAYAAEINYTLTDDDVVIKNGVITSCTYDFKFGIITIPDMLDGQSVIGIGDNIFKGKDITELSLPNTLEIIGAYAFDETSIKDLNIPASVRTIGAYAFSLNDMETLSFEVSANLQSIGDHAFEGNNITHLNLPEDLTYIGRASFNKNNVYIFDGKVFDGFIYAKNSDGTIDSSEIVSCARQIQNTLYIPEGVEKLGDESFSNQSNVTAVQLPSTITSIGNFAFDHCSVLEDISFGSSLTTIGDNAFYYCLKLIDIDFSSCVSLISIGQSAFNSCVFLKSVDLSSCTVLSSIGVKAFYKCTLNSFNLPPSNQDDLFTWVDGLGEYYEGGSEVTNLTIFYTSSSNKVVNFVDWDDSLLASDTVTYATAALAPANPSRDGYTFSGWDLPIDNVVANLIVKAVYKIDKIVDFIDWDSSLLSSDTVSHAMDATAPANPSREGYTFSGWNLTFDNVVVDLTVKAEYTINSYVVNFRGWDNTLLATETVEYTGDAIAPIPPLRENYTFVQWDKNITNITCDLIVNAEYTINTFIVTFMDWDNQLLALDTVDYGGAAILSFLPIRSGYTFSGWYPSSDNITSDQMLFAQYTIAASVNENPELSVNIYPNPASSMLTVESIPGTEISIYNLSGVALVSTESTGDNKEIDLSHIPQGFYLITVGKRTSRLCIER